LVAVRQPLVEILYFDGCANYEAVRELVEAAAAEIDVEPHLESIEVPDSEAAVKLRFLGSPSVRVDGRDVEPGAQERHDFALSCRVYQTKGGLSGRPDAGWVRDALSKAAG
jgi:hypothetical protein